MNIFKQTLFTLLLPTALFGAAEAPDHGLLSKFDKNGAPITLEWYKVGSAEELSRILTPLLPIMADAFADEDVLFRNFLFDEKLQIIKPECTAFLADIPEEMRQKIDARIVRGRHDRSTRVAETLQAYEQTLKNEWLAKWAPCNPYVVVAKEGEQLLGVTIVCRTSLEPGFELPYGATYLDELAVLSTAQGRGLARLLVFSVFDLIPEATQIFLDTGIWNTKAQAVYAHLGFEVRECKEFAHVGFVFTKQ